MKIVSIFDGKLYSFWHEGAITDELNRLLDLWQDTEYLYHFLKDNISDIPNKRTIGQLVIEIGEDADAINDTLYEICNNEAANLETFFRPLHNKEYKTRVLSLQKGRAHHLRIYAIKIDDNCFVVTGGAIKLTHLMEERPHTLIELQKLNQCRDYLKHLNIFDTDSFHEFIYE